MKVELSLLPRLLHEELVLPPAPSSSRFNASVLLADISGFTALARQLFA